MIGEKEQEQLWLEKSIEEYSNLEKFLDRVEKRLSAEVMVPIGSKNLAFMKGKVINTNQVTVSLGDDWFVEQSTFDAMKIIHRRVQAASNRLEALKPLVEDEKKLNAIKSQLSLPSHELNEDGERFVEIREEVQNTNNSIKQIPTYSTEPVKVIDNHQPDEFDLKLLEKLSRLEIEEDQDVESDHGIEVYESESESNNSDEEQVTVVLNRKTSKVKFSNSVTEIIEHADTVAKSQIPLSDEKKSLFRKQVLERDVDTAIVEPKTLTDLNERSINEPASILKTSTEENDTKSPVVQRVKEKSSTSTPAPKKQAPPIMSFQVKENVVESESDLESDLEDHVLGQHLSIEYLQKRNHLLQQGLLNTKLTEEELLEEAQAIEDERERVFLAKQNQSKPPKKQSLFKSSMNPK